MRTLGDATRLGNTAVNKQDIARALLERQLDKGSTNPGQTIRGTPGSLADQKLDALLKSAGADIPKTKQPLAAAELLQGFRTTQSSGTPPPVGFLGSVTRPLRAVSLAAQGTTQEKYMREIAELLSDPRNLPELQKIAMFDPMVRKLLTAQGAMIPFTQSEGGQ
jgi:hypothetical protein